MTSSKVTYAGYRSRDPFPVLVVFRIELQPDGTLEVRAFAPPAEPRHSPDGFNWGYGGAGPAELARSLLADALGAEGVCPVCVGTGKGKDAFDIDGDCTHCFGGAASDLVEHHYQDFKREVVANLPSREWTLSRERILSWVSERTGQARDVGAAR